LGRHPQNARETIIDAAEDVVIKVGARHLTLDAVAAKARVSKGGLLYHFPKKDDLLHAMLDRRVARFEEIRQKHLASLPKDPKSAIIAHVLSLQDNDKKTKKLSVSLLAAVAHDPQFLVPYQKEFKRLVNEFCQAGLTPERAGLILVAANGMRLLELFMLLPLTTKERNGIIKEILSLAKEEKHD
jgi:AcrR family transcriptional regulator